jgi:amino acid transporter
MFKVVSLTRSSSSSNSVQSQQQHDELAIPAPPKMATTEVTKDVNKTLDEVQQVLLSRREDEKPPAGYVWVERLLTPITNVAIFGGSITFSVVIGTHDGAKYMNSALPTFLALAWFFFVITLGLATATQQALSHYEKDLKEAFTPPEWTAWRGRGRAQTTAGEDDHDAGAVVVCAVLVIGKIGDLLCFTTLLAFVFLSLSVAAYELVIGLLATVCTGALSLVFAFTFTRQNVGVWQRVREQRPRPSE